MRKQKFVQYNRPLLQVVNSDASLLLFPFFLILPSHPVFILVLAIFILVPWLTKGVIICSLKNTGLGCKAQMLKAMEQVAYMNERAMWGLWEMERLLPLKAQWSPWLQPVFFPCKNTGPLLLNLWWFKKSLISRYFLWGFPIKMCSE